MLFWIVAIIAQLYLLRVVWTAVYDGRDQVNGVNASTLLVYLTISSLQTFFMPDRLVYEMEQRISTGRVANDLIRPFGFIQQMIALQIGTFAGSLPLLLVFVPLAIAIGSLRPPEPAMLAVYLVSLVLALLIGTLTWMMVGMAGFWLLNIGGLRVLISVTADFLAGALVPIWFMPDALRVVIQLLPFQAMSFLPASIFSGQASGQEVIRPLLVQAIWVVGLLFLVQFVWNRAQRKISIQGG
jgi:ABC-2 type transport system permease protein